MKKLSLHRETIAQLNPQELSEVQGGYAYPASAICPSVGLPCTQTHIISACRYCTQLQA